MTHTPGPWKAGSRSVSAPETEDRLGLDIRLYGGNGPDNRANTRLIAAAPELLAALRALVGNEGIVGYSRPYDDARAAIAKATGAPT